MNPPDRKALRAIMGPLSKLVRTPHDPVLSLLRLTLGMVMFPHGAQQVLGWFGGNGFSASLGSLAAMGIPSPLAFLAIMAEFAGSLGLIFGVFTRVAAFGIGMNMLVAILTVHMKFGFFMNWFGGQKGEGIEYHLLALGLAVAIIIRGGGAYSLDRNFSL